jgi:hypothetical protein
MDENLEILGILGILDSKGISKGIWQHVMYWFRNYTQKRNICIADEIYASDYPSVVWILMHHNQLSLYVTALTYAILRHRDHMTANVLEQLIREYWHLVDFTNDDINKLMHICGKLGTQNENMPFFINYKHL